jgi:hypothetical protein
MTDGERLVFYEDPLRGSGGVGECGTAGVRRA